MAHAIIIGGGIAGLAMAWRLSTRGIRSVVVERESQICTHASGRNAAIFRSIEPCPVLCRLAALSSELIDDATGACDWRVRCGAVYGANRPNASALQQLACAARDGGAPHVMVRGSELAGLAPDAPSLVEGIFASDDGTIDIHRVCSALKQRAVANGVEIRTGASVAHVDVVQNGFRVRFENGPTLSAPLVVNAAGAWASSVVDAAPLPLAPLRRHLAHLVPTSANVAVAPRPVVWKVDGDEVYWRAEGSGILASGCDESRCAPGIPSVDADVVVELAHRLQTTAPDLAANLALRRAWACLRTFAPDRGLVLGPDPRVPGLLWCAGLGGHGMTLGVAAADIATRLALGEDVAPETAAAVNVGRLLSGKVSGVANEIRSAR